ncbi:MAG: hypothetical protein OQK55_09070, partial [Thermoanaerobaculales bacterium]|nr:hypothetical protein [Thermoanaerobaculales bacterium]
PFRDAIVKPAATRTAMIGNPMNSFFFIFPTPIELCSTRRSSVSTHASVYEDEVRKLRNLEFGVRNSEALAWEGINPSPTKQKPSGVRFTAAKRYPSQPVVAINSDP